MPQPVCGVKRRVRATEVRRGLGVTALLVLGLGACVVFYVIQPTGWSSAAPLDGVDPARLEAHVRMLSETFAPRHWKRPDNLDRAAAYVTAQLAEAGARPSEQVYAVEGA